ncbi:MAG: hypothetical protein HYS87_00075, partial [Candidatus Colwellbacteria bacterium]|nr:hypothetical protein [Candidatus Colwellbacteria bacterium]
MNKKPLILSLILTMAFVFAGIQTVSAWNRPTSNPPGNNASAPLHTGSIGQIKEGGLTVGEGSGISVGLRVINGNVAIGLGSTGTPQQKLHVGGNIRAD